MNTASGTTHAVTNAGPSAASTATPDPRGTAALPSSGLNAEAAEQLPPHSTASEVAQAGIADWESGQFRDPSLTANSGSSTANLFANSANGQEMTGGTPGETPSSELHSSVRLPSTTPSNSPLYPDPLATP